MILSGAPTFRVAPPTVLTRPPRSSGGSGRAEDSPANVVDEENRLHGFDKKVEGMVTRLLQNRMRRAYDAGDEKNLAIRTNLPNLYRQLDPGEFGHHHIG